MSRPPSRQMGSRTSADNKGSGSQFLTDGEGDQNIASGGGNLYNDRRQWNIFHIADGGRGMPSMLRAFKTIDNGESDDNRVSAISKWLARQPHCRLDDCRNRQREFLNQITPGTGEWVLDTKEVQEWRNEETESRLVSIQGHLGSGKSILLCVKSLDLSANSAEAFRSCVIQSIQLKVQQRSDMACVYFHFHEGNIDQVSVPYMWASLLQQLLHQTVPTAVALELQQAFDDSLQGTNPIRPFEYFSYFKAQAVRFTTVYIILDALDNCQVYDDGKVQQSLSGTLSQLPAVARILFSSRQDLLARHLNFERILRIEPRRTDIEMYAKARIKNSENLHRLLSKEEDERRVIKRVTKQTVASQMFLIARLHLDRLGTNLCLPDLWRDLEQLPVDLAYVFQASLRKIATDCHPSEKGLAQHVLTWLVHSREVLTIDQICESFALSRNQGESYQEWRPMEDSVLSACAGLVVLNSDNTSLRLVHESAKKPILSHGIVSKEADHNMVKICLDCLLLAKNDSPLLSYSANHWTSHFENIDLANAKEVRNKIEAFFINGDKLVRAFTAMNIPQEGLEQSFNGMTGFHAIAYLDLPLWVKPLVEHRIKIDTRCCDGQTALHWAVAYGRGRVVRHLLGFSADPNAEDSSRNTPLHKFLASSASEGLEIARDLLNAGANVCVPNLKGVSPLSSAIRYGPTPVAELFILGRQDINEEIEYGWTSLREVFDHGNGRIHQLGGFSDGASSFMSVRHAVKDHLRYLVDIHLEKDVALNRPTFSGWLALSHVAKNGSVTMLKKLLEHRPGPADCNLKDPVLKKSPLRWALEYGHVHAARTLVKYGANVNEQNSDGWKPLTEAIKLRQYDMVHVLISKGADMNGTDHEDTSPVMHAVARGDKDLTWLLVVKGGDVNLRAKDGSHAIGMAIAQGDVSIAWLLYHHGADLKAVGDKGESLLLQAVKHGRQAVVTFLVDNGFDIGIRDQGGLSPLHHAVIGGSDDMVTALISRSAGHISLDIPDGEGKTPLIYALSKGRLPMVLDLLNHGSSCDHADAGGITALHYATAGGFTSALSSLIPKTRDINSTDNMGFTPIHHAVSSNQVHALTILINAGARVDILDRRGYTPLMLAVYLDKPESTRLLLEGGASIHQRNLQQISAVDLEEKKKGGKTPSRTQTYIAQALRSETW
ncbi:hypothetical protein FGRMN_5736 [Fusarium graminum]|nr:hypothetical protein FGRMN_5736 [Fusarium graminum]